MRRRSFLFIRASCTLKFRPKVLGYFHAGPGREEFAFSRDGNERIRSGREEKTAEIYVVSGESNARRLLPRRGIRRRWKTLFHGQNDATSRRWRD